MGGNFWFFGLEGKHHIRYVEVLLVHFRKDETDILGGILSHVYRVVVREKFSNAFFSNRRGKRIEERMV